VIRLSTFRRIVVSKGLITRMKDYLICSKCECELNTEGLEIYSHTTRSNRREIGRITNYYCLSCYDKLWN